MKTNYMNLHILHPLPPPLPPNSLLETKKPLKSLLFFNLKNFFLAKLPWLEKCCKLGFRSRDFLTLFKTFLTLGNSNENTCRKHLQGQN